MNSIIDYLEKWAEVQPDNCLSSFLNIDGKETASYTYQRFSDKTENLAEYLLRYVGIKHGERVLLVYPPGLDVIVAFVACVRVGAIPVPVCPPTSIKFEVGHSKLAFIAHDCQARVALTTRKFYESSRLLLETRKPSPLWKSSHALSKLEWITTDDVRVETTNKFINNPNSVLFLQYTSGSTGNPKGVIVSHKNIIHNALSTIDHVPIGVSWLPQYHDMGLIGYYLFPIVTGGTTYGFSPLDFLKRPTLWLETISQVRATYSSSPNFGFEYCLREDKLPSTQLSTLDLSSLKVLLNGAEPVQANTYLGFLERFKPYGLRPEAQIVAYGLAENTLTVTHYGRHIVQVNKQLLQQGKISIENYHPQNDKQKSLVSCGKPIEGVNLRIVDKQSNCVLGERQVGEIWVSGSSSCEGYWNRPELTKEVFGNLVTNNPLDTNVYIRTGDLGFLHEGELFVCGRLKDLIIIRGVNYYPHDIETIIQSTSREIRTGGVVAFNGYEDSEALIVVAEVRNHKKLPVPAEIIYALRTHCDITPHSIILVPRHTIVKTTSGKIARSVTRELFLNGKLPAIATHICAEQEENIQDSSGLRQKFLKFFQRYALKGNEEYSFAEIGIDSLTLVELIMEIEYLLVEKDASDLVDDLDIQFLQRLTVNEFFQLLDLFDTSSVDAINTWHDFLKRANQEYAAYIQDRMRSDTLFEKENCNAVATNQKSVSNVLLTGMTGFFGPFLLSSLLRQTSYTYYVLTRSPDSIHGLNRIRDSLRRSALLTPFIADELERRVHVICGDISRHNLGLPVDQWEFLSKRIQAVFHNAALVNYVKSYDVLRPHNVTGTRELLRFSFAGKQKEFHYISTTFIFGWSVKGILFESDNNDDIINLDFGYSQTKWVAEQMVFTANKQGLKVRVYRPSLISASTQGVWDTSDIAIRLLAFMINHRMAVYSRNQISFLPVDIIANNIVGIFKLREIGSLTLHVTADDYYNMIDITRLISSEYGYTFEYYDIPGFINEMNRRCTNNDPLFPLLDFFNRSYRKIAAMELKRYNNDQYRLARMQSEGWHSDPSLKDTVSYIMTYMFQQGLIREAEEFEFSRKKKLSQLSE